MIHASLTAAHTPAEKLAVFRTALDAAGCAQVERLQLWCHDGLWVLLESNGGILSLPLGSFELEDWSSADLDSLLAAAFVVFSPFPPHELQLSS